MARSCPWGGRGCGRRAVHDGAKRQRQQQENRRAASESRDGWRFFLTKHNKSSSSARPRRTLLLLLLSTPTTKMEPPQNFPYGPHCLPSLLHRQFLLQCLPGPYQRDEQHYYQHHFFSLDFFVFDLSRIREICVGEDGGIVVINGRDNLGWPGGSKRRRE